MPQGNASGSSDPHAPESSGLAVSPPSSSKPSQPEALQLCIETGKFTMELDQVNLNQTHTDGELFERIRESYKRTRHSIFPMWLRFSKPGKAIFIKVSYSYFLLQ